MAQDLRIKQGAANDARLTVESLGGEYETSLRYPIVGLAYAPKAQAGRNDLKVLWDQRREDELAGVEALAEAFTAIALSFEDADNQFNRALEELTVARNDSESGE